MSHTIKVLYRSKSKEALQAIIPCFAEVRANDSLLDEFKDAWQLTIYHSADLTPEDHFEHLKDSGPFKMVSMNVHAMHPHALGDVSMPEYAEQLREHKAHYEPNIFHSFIAEVKDGQLIVHARDWDAELSFHCDEGFKFSEWWFSE